MHSSTLSTLRVAIATGCLTLITSGCGGEGDAGLGNAAAAQPAAAAALSSAPSITALNVTGSPLEGGRMVLIVGSSLDPAASVTFGGVAAASVTPDAQSGGLVAVTPPNPEGFVDVVVTNPDGQSAVYHHFHYGPPPIITSISPTTVFRRGDQITITGANFAVTYGVQVVVGSAIAQILSKSPTQIVIAMPKLNVGGYYVAVSNFDSQYAVWSTPIILAAH